MKTFLAGLGALAASLVAASGLHAQQAPAAPAAALNPDVRCMVVGSALTQSADAATKTLGPVVLVYYLGRIDSETPKLDLEKAIRDELPNISTDFAAVAKGCVDVVIGRSKALGEINAHIAESAKPPAAAPAPAPAP